MLELSCSHKAIDMLALAGHYGVEESGLLSMKKVKRRWRASEKEILLSAKHFAYKCNKHAKDCARLATRLPYRESSLSPSFYSTTRTAGKFPAEFGGQCRRFWRP
jgi:hypothetical protein